MSDDAKRLLDGQAWRDWCDRLKALGEGLLADSFPRDDHARAEGYRWLTRLMVHATRMEIEAGDALHPRFVRYETPDNQWGGPNPDNVYLRANIDPSETYRVWAHVRGVRQAIFSLNEGDMQLGEFGVYSEHSLTDFERDDDRLEFRVSPDAQSGNWMCSDPKGRLLTIRIYQSDWEADAAPVFHIERVGAEGEPRPPLEPGDLARSFDRAASWVEASAGFWNEYTRNAARRADSNVAYPARPAPGGADHILYGSCIWRLSDGDEALLIECAAPDADYWGFSLHTLGWLESGDFDERQTSLNDHQMHVDADGRMRVVLCQVDPGVPNWIDVGARREGMLVYRWVWARDNPVPTSRLVKRGALRESLPEEHPRIDAAERRRRLSQRFVAATGRFQ